MVRVPAAKFLARNRLPTKDDEGCRRRREAVRYRRLRWCYLSRYMWRGGLIIFRCRVTSVIIGISRHLIMATIHLLPWPRNTMMMDKPSLVRTYCTSRKMIGVECALQINY